MYDGLYRLLDGLDVEVAVHADHPTLNRAVAERLGRGERIDVLSTHSKYAPSQARWLRPLDDLLPPQLIAALAPAAVERCRFAGALLSVPRNIDVRVLWANRRLLGGHDGAGLVGGPGLVAAAVRVSGTRVRAVRHLLRDRHRVRRSSVRRRAAADHADRAGRARRRDAGGARAPGAGRSSVMALRPGRRRARWRPGRAGRRLAGRDADPACVHCRCGSRAASLS